MLFGFYFISIFKLYLEKIINIALVGNVPGNIIFLLLFPEPQSFGRFGLFSEAKVKFSGSKILVKKTKKKNSIFFNL